MRDDPTNASIVYREDLNETLSIVRVRPDAGRVPPFTPGQFVTLGLPRGELPRVELPPGVAATRRPVRPGRVPLIRRAYSIASGAEETESLEFFVVLIEEGKLTPKLWSREFGERVWMDSEIKGGFTLERVPPGRDLVMISTGTGIAPFMSMLRTYRGQQRWRRFLIINGVRHVSDLGYRAELERIVREDSSVRYVPLVSRPGPEEGWSGLAGRVTRLLDAGVCRECAGIELDCTACHVFLCGNPAMIDDVERRLHERGFVTDTPEEPGNIHFERYW